MSSYADFQPIFARTEEDIRAAFDVRANAGLSATDPAWVDIRQGSLYYLATQPSVIEFASAYDRINEAIAAGILATSWGQRLDLHAASYGEERLAATRAVGFVTFTGATGTLIGTGARVGPVQTEPDIEPPIFETTASGTIPAGAGNVGTLTLAVAALNAGAEGNITANTVTFLHTGIAGVTAINNAAAFSSGSDLETDDALKERLKLMFQGRGSGTVADYAREALKWPGVGRVFVEPVWNGPGTVRLHILDDWGNPTGGTVHTDLQTHLDPVPAQGKGWAPINHIVTVVTSVTVPIHVDATVAFEEGYSLDGTAGAVALRTAITAAIAEYLNSLKPGEDVVYHHVRAKIFQIDGVYDVTALTMSITDPVPATGSSVNIAITPTQLARAGDIDLI